MCSPVGHYCAGGIAKVACPPNTYNALLGQNDLGDCKPCPAATPKYTSDEGASVCTLPLVDITCTTGSTGQEYDAASQTCVQCQAGTYRPTTNDPMSCIAW